MCSVEEGAQKDHFPSKKCNTASRTCMKCSEPAVVLVRMNDALCEACFLIYFTHKFRATLGKARVVRNGEKVLLAFSGGLSSSAMLHLVSEGYSDRVARKLRFQPGVVFIDEGTVLGLDVTDRKDTTKKIEQVAAGLGFPFYLARLEDVFSMENGEGGEGAHDACADGESKLKSLFESVSSLTAKEDLLKSLRHHVILGIARKEGYTKVMHGDCATRLSVRLLSNISQGRGGALPYDTGFGDKRHGDVMFIRPMREFMAKEIGLYNFFNKIEQVRIPALGTMATSHASIDRLTEGFVCNLQASFPFTVSTIFRTGDKLLAQETSDNAPQCSLCGVPRQENEVSTYPAGVSSVDSVVLSQGISGLRLEAADNKGPLPSDNSCEGSPLSSKPLAKLSWGSVTRTLCYGCQLTLKDTNCPVGSLPAFITDTVNRAAMKEQVKDFLLED